MIVYNHRMLEGDPIRYYQASAPIPIQSQRAATLDHRFSYFNRFDNFSSLSYEDPMMPNSPQSDSDNSVSSLDAFPHHKSSIEIISGKSRRTTESERVQCCWVSCGIFFESLDQLSAHVGQVHAASGPGGLFYCGWEGCPRNNKGFNARYKMLVHVRTHTNEKPHQCFQCDKAFSRAENLKIHSRSHSGEKPYVCPVPGCHKAYSNSSDRFKHTRTHQMDKPYQCKVPGCPKRYTDPSSLRKHVKTYKHYVRDEPASPDKTSLKIAAPCADEKFQTDKKSESCPCVRHNCCNAPKHSPSDGDDTSGVIKLSAYINLSTSSSHTKILDSFTQEPKKNIQAL